MQISGVKTREDALVAVDSFQLPPISEKADEKAKAEHSRQGDLVEHAKAFVKARLLAFPESVKVVGIEVRANVGNENTIEAFTFRIIPHK